MIALLNLQITIFLLIGVGFLIKRKNMVGKEGQKNLNDLVINVILPCNILKAFMVDFESSMAQEFLAVLLLSIATQVLFVIYGKIVFKKYPEGQRKCLQYGTICSNAGFLGNPIAEGVYGSYGLVLASIFLIPMRIMMWSEGLATFSGNKNMKDTMKKVCTHPCIVACVIGIVLMITGLRFPEPITKTIGYLGSCNTALSMCIIGMILEAIQWKELLDKTVLLYSFHRLILLPTIILLCLYFLPVSSIVKGLIVLLSAMPAGATTSILASKYEMEPEFATKMVITSTLFSIPTICLWSVFLKTMI
ncbi:MAG: AEC family transporter [Bacillota bacterium]|nr:AEC family transporter [Bacillota bacterium]